MALKTPDGPIRFSHMDAARSPGSSPTQAGQNLRLPDKHGVFAALGSGGFAVSQGA